MIFVMKLAYLNSSISTDSGSCGPGGGGDLNVLRGIFSKSFKLVGLSLSSTANFMPLQKQKKIIIIIFDLIIKKKS